MLILRLRISAWTITQLEYPIFYLQRLSERPNVGISGYKPLRSNMSKGKGNKFRGKNGYGLRVMVINNEHIPVKVLFDVRDSHNGDECNAIFSRDEQDCVGVFKSKIYCKITKELKPGEVRYYRLEGTKLGGIIKQRGVGRSIYYVLQ